MALLMTRLKLPSKSGLLFSFSCPSSLDEAVDSALEFLEVVRTKSSMVGAVAEEDEVGMRSASM